MSTLSRVPFVGIGTGRCGTTSLAKIIGACKNSLVTHEAYQLYWYEVTSRLGDLTKDMRKASAEGTLWGEVNQAVGPHVEDIRSSVRETRVVCLHRDKEDTVQSFVNFGSHKIRPGDKNNWINRFSMDSNDWIANSVKAFPVIDAWSVAQAYGFYWEYYETLMSRVREPVLHVQVEDLSSDETIKGLFDFLEVPESDRVFIENRKHYTIEEVRRLTREPASREQEQAQLLDRQGAGS